MDDYVTIYYDEKIHETDDANLYLIDDRKVWVPVSQIEDEEGDSFVIPVWLAYSKELI